MDIYEEIIKAGLLINHHESDLYVKKTPESEKIINNYLFKNSVTTFISQIDGEIWYDMPFVYTPFWKEKIRS